VLEVWRKAFIIFGSDRGCVWARCGGAVGPSGAQGRAQSQPDGDLQEAAANPFAIVRQLDDPRHPAIGLMPGPDTGLGTAINDRLRRAAAPR
jgi:L-threonylcarbamoyladenylate synthase